MRLALLKVIKELSLSTTFEASIRSATRDRVAKRATQTAQVDRICVDTNWLHHWKHPASHRPCSRLMQHLPKLREQMFLLLRPRPPKQSLPLRPKPLPLTASTFSNASTAPRTVMSGAGVIVSGRKSRPASCRTSLVFRNGFGFSDRTGSADSQASISGSAVNGTPFSTASS